MLGLIFFLVFVKKRLIRICHYYIDHRVVDDRGQYVNSTRLSHNQLVSHLFPILELERDNE